MIFGAKISYFSLTNGILIILEYYELFFSRSDATDSDACLTKNLVLIPIVWFSRRTLDLLFQVCVKLEIKILISWQGTDPMEAVQAFLKRGVQRSSGYEGVSC